LYIPIIVLVLFSFNSTGNTGSFSGPSLYWYRELFSSPETFNALKNTLVLAISTAIISTIIGTSAVVGIEKMKSKTVKGCMSGLKPAVVGLIGGAVITVGLTVFFPQGVNLAAFTQLKFYLAAGITAVMAVLAFKKVHPIIIICISAALGIAFGYLGLLG
jgi:chromate transporter